VDSPQLRVAQSSLIVSGRVATVQRGVGSFTISVYPGMRGADIYAHLDICAILCRDIFGQNVARHLPGINSAVSFCRELVAIQQNIVVVSLVELTYLLPPYSQFYAAALEMQAAHALEEMEAID
jgi:hypothetical protein